MKIKDHLLIGLISGLICPSIGIYSFYLVNSSSETVLKFLQLTIEGKILSPLLSLCAVINLGIFYIFIHFEHYYTARGVIFATMLYGVIIVLLKFVLK